MHVELFSTCPAIWKYNWSRKYDVNGRRAHPVPRRTDDRNTCFTARSYGSPRSYFMMAPLILIDNGTDQVNKKVTTISKDNKYEAIILRFNGTFQDKLSSAASKSKMPLKLENCAPLWRTKKWKSKWIDVMGYGPLRRIRRNCLDRISHTASVISGS